MVYRSVLLIILNVRPLCVSVELETRISARSQNCAMAVVHSSPTAELISNWMEKHQQQTNQSYNDNTTQVCRSVAHRDPNLLLALQENSCALHGPLCYFCRCVKRRMVTSIGWLIISRTDRGTNNLARKIIFHG